MTEHVTAPLAPRGLQVVPLELAEANALVTLWHRHRGEVVQHRFSIGAVLDGELVGAAIVGNPKARLTARNRLIIEVNRLVTNGTRNACSFLYGATARIAQAKGYHKIQTFILEEEPGTSLKAAGWVHETDVRGQEWDRPNRARKPADTSDKGRWAKYLNPPVTFTVPFVAAEDSPQEVLAI